MRKFTFFAVIALATLVSQPIHATSIVFSWNNSGDTGSLGTTHTYTVSGLSITALVFNDNGTTTGNQLFGKNGGGDETGIGTTADNSTQDEIVYADYVQLDFSNVLKNYTINSASITMGSTTGVDGWAVYGSPTQGGTITKPVLPATGTVTVPTTWSTPITGSSETSFSILNLLQSFPILAITETTAPSTLGSSTQPNVLIGQLTLDVTPRAAPEPATFGLIGCSLVGLAVLSRKARRG